MPPSTISSQDITEHVHRILYETELKVMPWFQTDETLLHYQPKAEAWSVAQILEHITLTSKYLLILIEKATSKAIRNTQERNLRELIKDYELMPKALTEVGLFKSFPWIRPAHMEPGGKPELAEVKATFGEQFTMCRRLLDLMPNGEGLRYQTTMTVNGLGKLDVYQYIVFLALHAQRHVAQMESNRNAWVQAHENHT